MARLVLAVTPQYLVLPRLHEAQLHEHLQGFSAGEQVWVQQCLELEQLTDSI